jgi:hypothetical protein
VSSLLYVLGYEVEVKKRTKSSPSDKLSDPMDIRAGQSMKTVQSKSRRTLSTDWPVEVQLWDELSQQRRAHGSVAN